MTNEKPPHQHQEGYHASSLRYLGYASQLGEIFRYVIGHKMVGHAYSVAIAYVIAETLIKSKQEYKQQKVRNYGRVLFVGMDTFLWHAFASIILPGIVLQRTSSFFYNRLFMVPNPVRGLTVAGLGIMTIPVIVRPIDDFVDGVLDVMLRKFSP
ncbi:hypothetical protein RN001_010796 [Aquatica leii]|uniref:Mitochondrial fission process protein 1 n=1 Tax=Aquatica leii TaxID=1421715 RepID=A0AAN7P1G8_9COLE|nr:hypothetical protein RN001_010796 [Aquatica leii]